MSKPIFKHEYDYIIDIIGSLSKFCEVNVIDAMDLILDVVVKYYMDDLKYVNHYSSELKTMVKMGTLDVCFSSEKEINEDGKSSGLDIVTFAHRVNNVITDGAEAVCSPDKLYIRNKMEFFKLIYEELKIHYPNPNRFANELTDKAYRECDVFNCFLINLIMCEWDNVDATIWHKFAERLNTPEDRDLGMKVILNTVSKITKKNIAEVAPDVYPYQNLDIYKIYMQMYELELIDKYKIFADITEILDRTYNWCQDMDGSDPENEKYKIYFMIHLFSHIETDELMKDRVIQGYSTIQQLFMDIVNDSKS